MPKPRPRGRRGLDKNDILAAAFDLMSEAGEAGFSVRKVGARAGVDPMTVLHHFGSREDLLREIADKALTTVELPRASDDWKADLRRVARAYRRLALRHPHLFNLHFRYHATGPADHASSEVVYRALRRTGLSDGDAAGLGLAFYALVIGLGLAEAGGLLQPVETSEAAELEALDPALCPATRALVPAFMSLVPEKAFAAAIDAFIDGVAMRTQRVRGERLDRAPIAAAPKRPALSTARSRGSH